jgi:hypothetical protein
MGARGKPFRPTIRAHQPTEQPHLFIVPRIGETFGRLTVTSEPFVNGAGRECVNCVCSCGLSTRLTRVIERFTPGAEMHCGCLADTRETERRTFVTPRGQRKDWGLG